jgi:outer membrane protein assembly factor BamD (BamD/ComL family)
MPDSLRFGINVVIILVGLVGIGWLLWWLLKNSTDPAALLFRWAITLGVLIGGYFFIDHIIGRDGGPLEKIIGVFAGMFFGLIIAGLWIPAIVDKVSGAFGSLYTGGGEPPTPQPFYSVAETRCKQGRFKEAIYAIQGELEKFPDDVKGHVMLASIQAEKLDDLPAAQVTIERFCQKPGHPPPHIAYALNALADWQLKVHDREAAQAALEKIVALLPDTEQANMAAQRIAHLASKETLLASHEHRPIHLQAGVRDLGLRDNTAELLRPDQDPAEQARQLAEHLTQHPLDNEARERLAVIYSEHYQRLDLAAEQFVQLVTTMNQTGRDVARWLNLLADLQLKHGADYDSIRATLERVVDLFPELAAAQLARQRIELLRLELKGKEKSQVVKLGSYEKDLGLKIPRPPNPGAGTPSV